MNEVVHTSPTIGSNVEEIVVKNTHFLMWDIGGQESLRSSWNTYYSNTEVRNTFGTHFVHYYFLSDDGNGGIVQQQVFFLSVAAGVFVQSTDGSRGRPSQRSAVHKGICLKSKARVSLRSVLEKGEEERESRGRGRCVGVLKESALKNHVN